MATTADVWAPWTDFERVIVDKMIDQWIKRFWAFMKAKENTLNTCCDWLYPTVCCLNALFQTIFKCFSNFHQHRILQMMHDRQRASANSNIMSAGSLLYTCYAQL